MSASKRERAFKPNHRLRFTSELWAKWLGRDQLHADHLRAGIDEFRALLEKGVPPGFSGGDNTIRLDELLLAIDRLRK